MTDPNKQVAWFKETARQWEEEAGKLRAEVARLKGDLSISQQSAQALNDDLEELQDANTANVNKYYAAEARAAAEHQRAERLEYALTAAVCELREYGHDDRANIITDLWPVALADHAAPQPAGEGE